MADNKFERVAPDDPRRCQATFKLGQCPYKAVDGASNCPMHGGNSTVRAQEAQNKKMYRLAKWKERMSEFADDANVKSLREEIGILRILMEETVNMCQDSQTLLMYSSKISDMAMKLEKLVSSCHRLEASTGMLLDKQAALQLASVIVKIIGEHVTDEDKIDAISSEIITAIVQTRLEVKQ